MLGSPLSMARPRLARNSAMESKPEPPEPISGQARAAGGPERKPLDGIDPTRPSSMAVDARIFLASILQAAHSGPSRAAAGHRAGRALVATARPVSPPSGKSGED